jgi:hypothetical protein
LSWAADAARILAVASEVPANNKAAATAIRADLANAISPSAASRPE